MAKTIGQLTQATTIASGDEFVIEQSGLTKRVAASVVRGGLVNADIDAAAAIAGSKLADGGIVTAKIADANVTPAKLSQPLTLATAQNTTSGTSIDFTGIPSWVKRITVMLNGVSTNGTSNPILQIGDSGGIETSAYTGATGYYGATSAVLNFSSGFLVNYGVGAATTASGIATICNVSGNLWVFGLNAANEDSAFVLSGGGSKTLSAALDRVRLTTVNGTDTFDAGSVNIMYEG
jgi:hypothetical protein